MKRILKYTLLLAVLAVLAFSGCKDEDVNPDGTPSPGTFKAYLMDSPADYEAVNIQILKVQAFVEGHGWVMLNNDPRTVNVLKLTNGAELELTPAKDLELPAGTYSKLRIEFGEENTVVLNPAASAAMGILGGGSGVFDLRFSGDRAVDLTINKKVNAKSGAYVLVDFDAAKSVYYDLNRFILRPTLNVIEHPNTAVRGEVNGAATASVTLTNGESSFGSFIDGNGGFLIRGVEKGLYDLIVMPGRTMDGVKDPEPKRISGVVVVEGEITSVGEINF